MQSAFAVNQFGDQLIVSNVTVQVEEALKAHDDILDALVVGTPDERWGSKVTAVIGPNGSGKSTVLNAIAGLLEPISGVLEVPARHTKELSVSLQAYVRP